MAFWSRSEADKYLAEARKFRRRKEYDRAGEYYELAGSIDEAVAMYAHGGQHAQAARLLEKHNQRKQAAEMYVKGKDYRAAADLYKKINDGRRAAQLYEKIGEHFKAAQIEEELRSYKRAGELYLRAGQRQRAASCFALERDYARAAFVLEEHLEKQGNAGDLEALRKEWLSTADLYLKAGNPAKAGELYERQGEHMRAGDAYEKANDHSKAIAMFLRAQAFDRAEFVRQRAPQGAVAPAAQATLLYAQGEWQQAGDLFKQVGDASRAADCYQRAGNRVAAAEQFEIAGDLEIAAELLHAAGEHARASRLYEATLRLDTAAGAARLAGEFERAAELYERAQRPIDAAACWREHGDMDRTISLLQKVSAEDPRYLEACVLLAAAFRQRGLASIAIEKLQGALGTRAVDHSNIGAFFALGELYEDQGQIELAVSVLEKVAAVDYSHADAAQRLERLRRLSASQPHPLPPPPSSDAGETLTLARPGTGNTSGQTSAAGSRYDIVGKLAESSRGFVYKAWDTSLGRTVVLKRLVPRDEQEGGQVNRYVHEAQQASKLHHSNIAAIYDAVEAPEGRLVAMEYVYGQSLRELLVAQGHLSPGRVIEIAMQILQALEYAHGQGVLHRNLRPENVMIAEGSHVKLTDFGMSRRFDDMLKDPPSDDSPLHYISPEHIRGQKLDAANDIYALGCVLYEALIGRPPHTGPGCDRKHLEATPVPPSQLEPSIPAHIEEVVLKCLAKTKEERYASARQVIEALRTSDFVPGQRIGDRYELEVEIGSGGMGKVFKAKDLELEETIAMKILRPELGTDSKLEQRFIREIKLARKIAHPSVVKVFDFGKWNDTKYITMEYIDGISLDEYVRRSSRPDVAEIAGLMVQLADALHAAHRLGVIHRDIKPQNVLLASDGTAKIVDFGIARLDQAEDLTSSRHIIGSPKYMSPEQIMGHRIDHRTDIYSLGVVMYFCLTGIEPFTSEDTNGIIMKQLRQNPTPPCQVNPDLPPWIELVVLKCLVKDPAGRYQSMAEAAVDIRAHLADSKG